ncbi:MAG TPA: hypothetical protein VIH91_04965 [Terriglobales bacterium]
MHILTVLVGLVITVSAVAALIKIWKALDQPNGPFLTFFSCFIIGSGGILTIIIGFYGESIFAVSRRFIMILADAPAQTIAELYFSTGAARGYLSIQFWLAVLAIYAIIDARAWYSPFVNIWRFPIRDGDFAGVLIILLVLIGFQLIASICALYTPDLVFKMTRIYGSYPRWSESHLEAKGSWAKNGRALFHLAISVITILLVFVFIHEEYIYPGDGIAFTTTVERCPNDSADCTEYEVERTEAACVVDERGVITLDEAALGSRLYDELDVKGLQVYMGGADEYQLAAAVDKRIDGINRNYRLFIREVHHTPWKIFSRKERSGCWTKGREKFRLTDPVGLHFH